MSETLPITVHVDADPGITNAPYYVITGDATTKDDPMEKKMKIENKKQFKIAQQEYHLSAVIFLLIFLIPFAIVLYNVNM